jgi:ubiquinone/menaquinone biosynthesis C-methylase UbiE
LCENEYITILDLGTGTAQIPILLCQQMPRARILATDAAESMLKLAKRNIYLADLNDSIRLAHVDCKRLTFAADTFDIVMSNSIVHHIPTPEVIFSESVRVAKNGGTIFLRDLARPADKNTLDSLVATYAADCNSHQRQLFADSLHAALTVDEVRQIVVALGFSPKTVEMTSDRHWTWAAVKRS